MRRPLERASGLDTVTTKQSGGAPNAVLRSGFSQPEGPVHLADGSLAIVEMGENRECVTLISPDGATRTVARPGGRPTGLALDGDGCLWVAGGPANSLVRLDPSGAEMLRVTGSRDDAFLFPNDLAFGPDGMLYMTDSGILPRELISGLAIRSDFLTYPYRGQVVRIDPRKGVVERQLARDLRFANGIAFDGDGVLHYAETLTGRIHRQPLDEAPEVFAAMAGAAVSDRFTGPDGMAFDEDGRLFCAIYGESRIAVADPGGRPLPSLRTNGDRPTNVAFRGAERLLMVTEVANGAVEIVPTSAAGLPLHVPRIDRR